MYSLFEKPGGFYGTEIVDKTEVITFYVYHTCMFFCQRPLQAK
jgi:hypothetical protein